MQLQEYYGHKNEHNQIVFQHLTAQKKQLTQSPQALQGKFDGIIYLAGDSSLDNKNWFRDTGAACNSMEQLLAPPGMYGVWCGDMLLFP